MGLDSVEMIIEWEKYFNIQIPDKQAERIYTLQDATDYISAYLNINEYGLELRDNIFLRIQQVLKDQNLISRSLDYKDYVNKIVFENKKTVWDSVSTLLQLEIPPPFFAQDNSMKTKLFSGLFWTPQINYETLSFEQLVDGICGCNYRKLVDNSNIHTNYEVYISILGMTVDKLGVEFYELEPGKSFTDDLGMD